MSGIAPEERHSPVRRAAEARMETAIEEVVIPAGEVALKADLVLPFDAQGLIVFAHGSGSSRSSPRNRMVADKLHDSGFATLLCDLLSEEEHNRDAVTSEYSFDITLLAERLIDVIDWIGRHETIHSLPLGLFGAGAGSAAALIAAAERPEAVKAVVSRGGRPDLAEERLEEVRAPTLLMVGSLDRQVLELNENALTRISAVKGFIRIQGASHLFEEPGNLEEVSRRAAAWFTRYSSAPPPPVTGA